MNFREMTASEQAIIEELGQPIPEGSRIVAGQWKLSYPENEADNGVSNTFYNKMCNICYGWGLWITVQRSALLEGSACFTITIGR